MRACRSNQVGEIPRMRPKRASPIDEVTRHRDHVLARLSRSVEAQGDASNGGAFLVFPQPRPTRCSVTARREEAEESPGSRVEVSRTTRVSKAVSEMAFISASVTSCNRSLFFNAWSTTVDDITATTRSPPAEHVHSRKTFDLNDSGNAPDLFGLVSRLLDEEDPSETEDLPWPLLNHTAPPPLHLPAHVPSATSLPPPPWLLPGGGVLAGPSSRSAEQPSRAADARGTPGAVSTPPPGRGTSSFLGRTMEGLCLHERAAAEEEEACVALSSSLFNSAMHTFRAGLPPPDGLMRYNEKTSAEMTAMMMMMMQDESCSRPNYSKGNSNQSSGSGFRRPLGSRNCVEVSPFNRQVVDPTMMTPNLMADDGTMTTSAVAGMSRQRERPWHQWSHYKAGAHNKSDSPFVRPADGECHSAPVFGKLTANEHEEEPRGGLGCVAPPLPPLPPPPPPAMAPQGPPPLPFASVQRFDGNPRPNRSDYFRAEASPGSPGSPGVSLMAQSGTFQNRGRPAGDFATVGGGTGPSFGGNKHSRPARHEATVRQAVMGSHRGVDAEGEQCGFLSCPFNCRKQQQQQQQPALSPQSCLARGYSNVGPRGFSLPFDRRNGKRPSETPTPPPKGGSPEAQLHPPCCYPGYTYRSDGRPQLPPPGLPPPGPPPPAAPPSSDSPPFAFGPPFGFPPPPLPPPLPGAGERRVFRPCYPSTVFPDLFYGELASGLYGFPLHYGLLKPAMKPRSGPANELHKHLEESCEQWRGLEKERKKAEMELTRSYPGSRVPGPVGIALPRLPPNPSRVDRLVVDQLRENARVVAVLGHVEALLGQSLPASVVRALARHVEAVRGVQDARRSEVMNAALRHKQGAPRHRCDKDVLALAYSVRALGVATRRARLALWCGLQLGLPECLRGDTATHAALKEALRDLDSPPPPPPPRPPPQPPALYGGGGGTEGAPAGAVSPRPHCEPNQRGGQAPQTAFGIDDGRDDVDDDGEGGGGA
ncbi:unnamed protein product [Lampetra planeri]